MIKRVAVVPLPPLLVPELAPGVATETAGVRDAVSEAVAWLGESSRHWHAIGAHDGPRATFEPPTCGSFGGFGVDVPVSLSDDTSAPASADLPLPVLVAGWLRAGAGAASVRVDLVPTDLPAADCLAIGQELAGLPGADGEDSEDGEDGEDTVLLVLGDGSIRHGERAPGRQDARASGFDAAVATALAAADPAALAALDPTLAAELGACGRAPWQIAAGVLGDGRWVAKLRYSDMPFGVAYHVATWERT